MSSKTAKKLKDKLSIEKGSFINEKFSYDLTN